MGKSKFDSGSGFLVGLVRTGISSSFLLNLCLNYTYIIILCNNLPENLLKHVPCLFIENGHKWPYTKFQTLGLPGSICYYINEWKSLCMGLIFINSRLYSLEYCIIMICKVYNLQYSFTCFQSLILIMAIYILLQTNIPKELYSDIYLFLSLLINEV